MSVQKDRNMTKKAIKYSFIWASVLALGYATFYFFGGHYLISVFTSDVEVIDFTMQFLFWMAVLPIAGFASYIWDGVYIGFTASKSMRDTMIIALILYLGTYYLMVPHWPEHALWIALICYLFARGLLQTIYFYWKGEALD